MGDIKTLKPSGPYQNGKFIPINKEKYVGEYPIIYRSSLELRFCKICDENSSILYWTSEPNKSPFPIRYHHPVEDRPASYYPDYLIYKRDQNGNIQKLIIEIKPEALTLMPPKPANNATLKTRRNYVKRCQMILVNLTKKEAAEKFAAHYGLVYMFFHERNFSDSFLY